MSTRCMVGMEHSDGSIESIVIFHDGYPQGEHSVGEKLNELDTADAVQEMINQGNRWTFEDVLDTAYDPNSAMTDYLIEDVGLSKPRPVLKDRTQFCTAMAKEGITYGYLFSSKSGWSHAPHK